MGMKVAVVDIISGGKYEEPRQRGTYKAMVTICGLQIPFEGRFDLSQGALIHETIRDWIRHEFRIEIVKLREDGSE